MNTNILRGRFTKNLPWLVYQVRKEPRCTPLTFGSYLERTLECKPICYSPYGAQRVFTRLCEEVIGEVGKPQYERVEALCVQFLLDCFDRASRLVECISICIKHFLPEVASKGLDHDSMVAYWLWRACAGTLEKEAKNKFAAIYSWVNDQEMPSFQWDAFDQLGSNTFRRKLRALRTSRPKRVREFAFNLLQLKKGTLRPDNVMCQESVDKHLKLVTDHTVDVPESLLSQVRRTALEVAAAFPKRGSDGHLHPRITRPSLRAAFENGVATGGCLEVIRQLGVETFLRMDYHPRVGVIAWQAPDLKDLYNRAWLYTINRKQHPKIFASPVALKEAFKVRIITKAEAIPHWCVQPYQKLFWGALQKFRCFRITGRPECTDDVEEMFDCLQKGEKLVSGDYSSATDLLSSACSQAVLDVWKPYINPLHWDLVRSALVGHILDYGSEVREQTNGQLMGSFLSFPILCVVNAALCRLAIEKLRNRKIPLCNAPMLINGDDCLFPADDKSYDYWKRKGTQMGLEPSLGKNYFSDSFAIINSSEFRIRPNMNIVSSCDRTPYINLGILFGNKRSQGDHYVDHQQETPSSLTSEFKFFKEAMGYRFSEEARSLFLSKRRDLLQALPNSWALPPHMGGLGLVDRELSVAEKCWATYWRDHPEARISLTMVDDPVYIGMSAITARELNLGGLRRCESSVEWFKNQLLQELSDAKETYDKGHVQYPHYPVNRANNVLVDDDIVVNGVLVSDGERFDRTRIYARKWKAIMRYALAYCEGGRNLGHGWDGEALDSWCPRAVLSKRDTYLD